MTPGISKTLELLEGFSVIRRIGLFLIDIEDFRIANLPACRR